MCVYRKQEEIEEMIMSYLQKHPDAGDTLEGITRWWLELERIDQSGDEVATAIESLVKKGSLKKFKCQGSFSTGL